MGARRQTEVVDFLSFLFFFPQHSSRIKAATSPKVINLDTAAAAAARFHLDNGGGSRAACLLLQMSSAPPAPLKKIRIITELVRPASFH